MNKKLSITLGIVILVVSAAAFTAGNLLNRGVSPLGLLGLGGRRGSMEISINLIPAQELPGTPPDVIGLFAERRDKTILVQSTSLKTGGAGVAVHKNEDGSASSSSNMNYGPKVEVIITNETIVYRDTTQPNEPPSAGNVTLQQTVQESTLDDLNSQSEVTVWGRKSGDRIIAEVLLYSDPVLFQGP
jgi:hypothetical protein